jgi:hypothetical protein
VALNWLFPYPIQPLSQQLKAGVCSTHRRALSGHGGDARTHGRSAHVAAVRSACSRARSALRPPKHDPTVRAVCTGLHLRPRTTHCHSAVLCFPSRCLSLILGACSLLICHGGVSTGSPSITGCARVHGHSARVLTHSLSLTFTQAQRAATQAGTQAARASCPPTCSRWTAATAPPPGRWVRLLPAHARSYLPGCVQRRKAGSKHGLRSAPNG